MKIAIDPTWSCPVCLNPLGQHEAASDDQVSAGALYACGVTAADLEKSHLFPTAAEGEENKATEGNESATE